MMMMLDDVAMPGTTSFHPTGRGASETGVLGSRFCVVGIFGGNVSEQNIEACKIKGFETDQMAQNQYSVYEALDTPL